MNKSNTALVLVDPQNDFLDPKGKMYPAVQAVLEQHDMPNRLNQLIGLCRDQSIRIFFTPVSFGEGYPEAGPNPYGIMSAVADSGAFIRGTWGAQVADCLDRQAGDEVVEKHRICAFEGTDLERRLRDQGIETLIVAGLLSDHCVESTMRAAYDKGFEVFSVVDAIATMNKEKHAITVEHDYPLFSKPVSYADAVTMLTQS